MLYRKLGKSGFNVSILGYGAMRLPIQGGSQSSTDRFDPNKSIDEEANLLKTVARERENGMCTMPYVLMG